MLGGDDDETTLSLAALEDRQAIEAEFGGLLDELPTGVGMVVVRRGPNQGSSFMLDRTVTSLGRHPDSDIFRDDGSLNGTYVDHERVEVAPLRDLNEIQIGRFVLTFVLGSGPSREEIA
jgi:pSer/pThr/pTyr-binding forkhead associated (FHA) protein